MCVHTDKTPPVQPRNVTVPGDPRTSAPAAGMRGLYAWPEDVDDPVDWEYTQMATEALSVRAWQALRAVPAPRSGHLKDWPTVPLPADWPGTTSELLRPVEIEGEASGGQPADTRTARQETTMLRGTP